MAVGGLLLALPAALMLRRPVAPGGRPDRFPRVITAGVTALSGLGVAASLLVAFGAWHAAVLRSGW